MANDTVIIVVGNLTADPELRFTPSGRGGRELHRRLHPRTFDRQSTSGRTGRRCSCAALWRSPRRTSPRPSPAGARVIVQGRLKQRSFETREGEKRTVIELEVDEIGASLRYATAAVTKASRTGGRPAGSGDDPWAAAPAGAGADSGHGGDEPPF